MRRNKWVETRSSGRSEPRLRRHPSPRLAWTFAASQGFGIIRAPHLARRAARLLQQHLAAVSLRWHISAPTLPRGYPLQTCPLLPTSLVMLSPKLEREAIDAFEQRGGDAFTRLEREVLRPKEVHHESQLMQLKDRVQQLHLEARAHVLLESDAQNSLAEIKGKVRELQLAFRSLSELVVEEIDGMRAEQRKQRDDIDALWRSHREMATL